MKLKTLILLPLIVTGLAHANDIEVSSSPSVLVSAEQSKGTVFHVSVPENSVVIATVYGGDQISSAQESSAQIKEVIDGNSVSFLISKPGQYAMSAITKCGLSFSIVANVLKSDAKNVDIKKYLPKVAIQGASCPAVTQKN
tara:strand:- start:705 stop:1127 length:423 start_codon:yes stop_codon:yes gene_type:complete